MPSVNRQNVYLILEDKKTIIRGQSQTIVLDLHRNYVGNLIDLNQIYDLTYKLNSSNGAEIKTGSFRLGTVSVGIGDTQGQMSFTITGTETLNLPSGDLEIDVVLTDASGQGFNAVTILPKLKVATIANAGETLPDGSIAGRIVTPNVIYSVKSFSEVANPAPSEIILNSDRPVAVNRIRLNNTDDNGKRNALLEQALIRRFDTDNADLSITLTNVNNGGEYAKFKLVSWSRFNVTDLVAADDTEYTDGIQLMVTPEGHSRTGSDDLEFPIGTSLGLTLDIFSSPAVKVQDILTKNITFTGGATLTRSGDTVNVAVPILGNGNIINGVDGTSGTSGTSGIDGAAGAAGEAGTSGTSGTNGSSGINGEAGTSGTSGTSDRKSVV